MSKRLIINADDFGLSSAVNAAIADAHHNGVLTSATIMTNMPAANEAVEMAKQLPSLGLGVHLNLTAGRCLSDPHRLRPLLDATGCFCRSPKRLAVLSALSPALRNAVKAEFAAQIRWLIDKGLRPTHLDSHKHIHALPFVFPIVCRLAKEFQIGAVRFTFEPRQVCSIPWPLPAERGKQKSRFVRTLARINRWQNRQFFKTGALLGVAHVGKIDSNFYRAAALYFPAAVVEIMTHPGLPESGETSQMSLLNRKREYEALCSDATRKYLSDAAIQVIHYGRLQVGHAGWVGYFIEFWLLRPCVPEDAGNVHQSGRKCA